MKKLLLIAFALFLVLGLAFISGCGKNASEKAAEKAIEDSTNGQADVDLDEQKVTLNTNEGTIEVGGEIKLPDGFPSDVYVASGTIKSASTITANSGFSVMIETNESVADLAALYDTKLKEDGWTITMTLNLGSAITIAAEKASRTANVTVGQGENGAANSVLIATGNK